MSDSQTDLCDSDQSSAPCECESFTGWSLSLIELLIYTVIMLVWLSMNRKSRQIWQVYVLTVIIWLAFATHSYSTTTVYLSANHCKPVKKLESFILYMPQALFFSIFVWVIFKLLFIWRCLELDDNQRAIVAERKMIDFVQFFYVTLWLVLWLT